MDERQGGYQQTADDPGAIDAALIAEYDLAGSAGPEMSAGTPIGKSDTGEKAGDETRSAVVTGTAEGRRVDIRGVVALARGEKTKVKGISMLAVGDKVKVKGVVPIAIAADELEIKKAANVLAVAGQKIEVEDHGYVAFAVAPRMEVEDGGRVLIGLWAAAILGLAAGLGFGLAGVVGITSLRKYSRRN